MAITEPRQRKKPEKPEISEEELLDDEEQEEVLAKLEADAQAQVERTKLFFAIAGSVLTLIYVGFAATQAVAPWSLQHHRAFAGSLSSGAVIVGEIGAAITVLAATAAVLSFGSPGESTWRNSLTYSTTAALMMLLFWSSAIVKVAMEHRQLWTALWRVAWRPIAPGAVVAGAVAVIDGLDKIRPELLALKNARYALRKA